jgi:dCMP deaminase
MNDRMKKFYMDVASNCSTMSRAIRLQVGCVIVKDDNIISFSWNGTPTGWDNNCEDQVWDKGAGGWLDPDEFDAKYPYEGWHEGAQRNVRYGLKTKPEVLHAESNAVSKLAKSNNSGQGADLFVTHAPCMDCAKLIYQSGISNVYYRNSYRDVAGVEFLEKSGIQVEKLNLPPF